MKSISKNSIYYIIYNLLNIIFPLITGIYVSHVLLSSSIGEVEAARNLAQYFVILAFLGIPTYGLREIAKARNNKEELSKVFSELTIINAVSTTIFLGIYFVFICSIPTYRNSFWVYFISGGSIALNFLNITWLYEGLEEFSFICIRNLIFKILCFVLLVIFVRDDGDYLIYAAITIIGIAGNYIFNVLHAKKRIKFTFKGLNFKKHISPVLFLVVVNFAIEIYTLVDITMLKLIVGNDAVAYYSYGSKIYKILLTLLNSFTMVIVPRLTYLKKQKDLPSYNNLISKTLNIILIFSIPILIGIVFTSDYLITAIYGSGYIKSSTVLKILSINLVISPIGYLLGSRVMLVSGKEKYMVVPVAIGALVNISCNAVLIRTHGEVGAAIASVIGEFFVALIYILFSRKEFKLRLYRKNLITLFSAVLLMTASLLIINFTHENGLGKTIKEIVVASFVYFSVLIALGEETVKRYFNILLSKFVF